MAVEYRFSIFVPGQCGCLCVYACLFFNGLLAKNSWISLSQ